LNDNKRISISFTKERLKNIIIADDFQYNLEGMKMVLEEYRQLNLLEAYDGNDIVTIYKQLKESNQ